MTVGRFVVSVLRSSLPAVISMSVSHSVNQTHRSPREKEKCASLGIILGFHAFILVFYFHLVIFLLLLFFGKLTTGRPWPTPWPTPRFVPTRQRLLKIFDLRARAISLIFEKLPPAYTVLNRITPTNNTL